MKSRISAVELAAIEHYRKHHNVTLMLGVFPTVNFRDRDTQEVIQKDLAILVHEHSEAKEEDSKQRAAEKKKIENDEKWKRRY